MPVVHHPLLVANPVDVLRPQPRIAAPAQGPPSTPTSPHEPRLRDSSPAHRRFGRVGAAITIGGSSNGGQDRCEGEGPSVRLISRTESNDSIRPLLTRPDRGRPTSSWLVGSCCQRHIEVGGRTHTVRGSPCTVAPPPTPPTDLG
jgi:hypothetical protein